MYHHGLALDYVRHDIIAPYKVTQATPEPDCGVFGDCDHFDRYHDALHYEACYRWLTQRIGYWPIWMAVGNDDDDRRMTNYADQFRRWPEGLWGYATERKNMVMFSWHEMPAPTINYIDYPHWFIVLNSVYSRPRQPHHKGNHHHEVYDVSPYYERRIMRRSWTQRQWLAYAAKNPHSVQGLVPTLDLRTADEVWCRNKDARQRLLDMGFKENQVQVKRLSVGHEFG